MVAPLLVLLWLCDGPLRQRWSEIRHSPTSLAVLLFILLNVVSLAWSSDLAQGWDYVGKYRHLLLVPVLATSLRPRFVQPLLAAFLAGSAVTVLWSYGLCLGLVHVGRNYPEHPAPTMSHLDYSMFLAFVSLLVLHRSLRRSQPLKRRLCYIAGFLFFSTCLFINIGRSGQLAFFGTLLVVLPAYLRVRPIVRLAVTAAAVALALVAIYSTIPVFKQRTDAAAREIKAALVDQKYDSNQGKRVASLIVSVSIIRTHPFLGTGVADNMVEFRRLLEDRYAHLQEMIGWYPHLHNQYLQVGSELGLAGLLLLINIFVQLLREPGRVSGAEIRWVAATLAWIFLFGFLGDPFFHKQLPMTLFAVMAGLVCSVRSPRWQQAQASEPAQASVPAPESSC